ncbi:hypothetical protein [Streptomyces sp. NPDC005438]|uniref:HAAS signaling domain-containing protein n=1 Tax=Streptomyces sp. NPDC005438 TaxID=3156880 RepID=UPI0033A5330A
MSRTSTHPLVRAYLSSVERETATLPDARRRDLVADLREHIESVRAEGGDEPVQETLDRLGTPREIAAAAIEEEPGVEPPRPDGRARTAVTLGMLVLSAPLWVVGVGLVLAVLAAVRIWRSTAWSRRNRRLGVICAFSPLLVTPGIAALFSAGGRLGAPQLLCALLLSAVIPLAAAVRLGRDTARLRTETP